MDQDRWGVDQDRTGRSKLLIVTVATWAALGVAGLVYAADGNCPNKLPFCFEAGNPVVASQVNTNFDQIVDWLEAKVGGVDSAGATVADLRVTGSETVDGSTTLKGSLSGQGAVTFDRTLRGKGDVTFDKKLTTKGSTTLDGSLRTKGSTTLDGTLRTKGNATLDSKLTVKGDLVVQGNVTGNFPSSGCYTRWGNHGCTSGYAEVVRGHTGGLESYDENHGSFSSNVECVADSAPAHGGNWPSTYGTRLMRSDEDGDGMAAVRGRCSVCCQRGCYTGFGQTSCASGYDKVYQGRAGGVEAYSGNRPHGETLCVDSGASARHNWPNGYRTRLMRHYDAKSDGNTGGMRQVRSDCVVCCN